MEMDQGFVFTFVLYLAGFIMILAALSDAMSFKIPNLACLALILLFPSFVVSSPSEVSWPNHLLVFITVLGIGYFMYLQQWAGAGDIKLVAAISLWAGPPFWAPFLFITAVVGGLFSIVIGVQAYIKQRKNPSQGNNPAWTKTPIPYGIAIALGGLCTLTFLSHPELMVSKEFSL